MLHVSQALKKMFLNRGGLKWFGTYLHEWPLNGLLMGWSSNGVFGLFTGVVPMREGLTVTLFRSYHLVQFQCDITENSPYTYSGP